MQKSLWVNLFPGVCRKTLSQQPSPAPWGTGTGSLGNICSQSNCFTDCCSRHCLPLKQERQNDQNIRKRNGGNESINTRTPRAQSCASRMCKHSEWRKGLECCVLMGCSWDGWENGITYCPHILMWVTFKNEVSVYTYMCVCIHTYIYTYIHL